MVSGHEGYRVRCLGGRWYHCQCGSEKKSKASNTDLRHHTPTKALLLHSLALDIEKLLDRSFNLIVLAFAGMLENDSAALVDDVLRWPMLISIGFPCCVIIVLCNRVGNTMALDRGLDLAGHLFECGV